MSLLLPLLLLLCRKFIVIPSQFPNSPPILSSISLKFLDISWSNWCYKVLCPNLEILDISGSELGKAELSELFDGIPEVTNFWCRQQNYIDESLIRLVAIQLDL